jgi:AcrR family transcriptional regulator
MTAKAPGAGSPAGSRPEEPSEQKSTRERILDIALELFTEQGYDKTSLRQIAARLGFSKAAIYYHFASKEDILMELHLRLHEFVRGILANIDAGKMSLGLAAEILDQLVEQMMGHRALFVLFQRNQAALDELHRERHDGAHEDVEILFRRVLSSQQIPLRDRVRIACALGAVMGGVLFSGDVFSDVPAEDMRGMLQDAARALLAPEG